MRRGYLIGQREHFESAWRPFGSRLLTCTREQNLKPQVRRMNLLFRIGNHHYFFNINSGRAHRSGASGVPRDGSDSCLSKKCNY